MINDAVKTPIIMPGMCRYSEMLRRLPWLLFTVVIIITIMDPLLCEPHKWGIQRKPPGES